MTQTTIIVQVIAPVELYGPGDKALSRWRDARGVEWAHYAKADFVGNDDPEQEFAFRPQVGSGPYRNEPDGYEICDLCHNYLFRPTNDAMTSFLSTFWLSKRGEVVCESCMKLPAAT